MRVRDDRGSSVVDFVLVSTLLVFLLFAVIQVAVLVYARNVVAAAAADGARAGAAYGATPGDGARRAAEVMHDGLPSVAAGVRCEGVAATDASSGLATTTVRCRGRMHAVLLPLRLPLDLDSESTVLRESPP